jgi:RNAse (barnase) inhibitor barstar
MLPAMYSQKCYILAKGQPLSTKELHKLWQKTCKVQKPITIYWGTSKFKKGFNSKYYYSIMDYTVNLMLGYEATHDN